MLIVIPIPRVSSLIKICQKKKYAAVKMFS